MPALSVALHRADRPLWQLQVDGAGGQSQFRIGSVTKTFTAVLVLQARDDGLLDLDDPIGRHLDLPAHGERTVCQAAVAHLRPAARAVRRRVGHPAHPDAEGLRGVAGREEG